MHDLNESNPRLTMFLAELSWCCFCAEIKFLGMERNFARIFHINNKNFWSQDLPERGTWVGTTHQGMPPLLARRGGLYQPGGPADPKTDAINSYFWRKNQVAIHETELPPSPVLPREGRSGVRLELRRGRSSFFVIANPSPSPIP